MSSRYWSWAHATLVARKRRLLLLGAVVVGSTARRSSVSSRSLEQFGGSSEQSGIAHGAGSKELTAAAARCCYCGRHWLLPGASSRRLIAASARVRRQKHLLASGYHFSTGNCYCRCCHYCRRCICDSPYYCAASGCHPRCLVCCCRCHHTGSSSSRHHIAVGNGCRTITIIIVIPEWAAPRAGWRQPPPPLLPPPSSPPPYPLPLTPQHQHQKPRAATR